MLEIIFGLISGTVTGMGMGGGAVLILLLSAFLGMEQHMAQATNLVFFVPTAIATIITNIRQKNINFKLTIITSIFGIIGAIIGSIISNKITSNLLKKYFAIFILIIAFHEVYELYKEYKKRQKNT